MNFTPLVSVIIPFLDAKRFLAEAVESVLAQTYQNWELLLVDDGSTDDSTPVARRYAEHNAARICCLQHPDHQNQGQAASRNLGVAASRGSYLAFLDADDVWLPNKLERQIALLHDHPEAAMVFGPSLRWYSWTGKAEDASLDRLPRLGVEPNRVVEPPTLLTLSIERKATTPCPSNVLLRRAAVEHVGGFVESFRGRYGLYEDQAFFAKITVRYPVFVSNEIWDRHRRHPDSCAAVVKRDGQAVEVRGTYLRWLADYLATQHIDDKPLHAALRRQLRPYRHPHLSRLTAAAKGVRSEVARVSGAAARRWIQT